MSYGSSDWEKWVLDEEESVAMLKAAYDAGINTWDTADVYSNGQSEVVIRKAIEKHKIPRERLVLLTKCLGIVDESNIANRINAPRPEYVNLGGLSRKHIFDAVDASVRRLGTYIGVLQIHRLDSETEGEEIMKALHDVVMSGKVRYIGEFDKPTQLRRVIETDFTQVPRPCGHGSSRSSSSPQPSTTGLLSSRCRTSIILRTEKRSAK